jgi:Flp pilus assembly protein TadB
MLWIFGAILIAVWLVLKFLLHKSGLVHVTLLIALTAFLIQFVQDRRTRAYERSLNSHD